MRFPRGTLKKRGALPQEDPADKCSTKGTESILRQLLGVLSRIIFDTPDSISETVWRVFSVLGLSTILIAGYTFWRYPDLLASSLSGSKQTELSSRLIKNQDLKRRAMVHISSFIHRSQPARFALVSWPTATTGQLVWDTGSIDQWPVTLQGIYSPNLVQAAGPLLFGECWNGLLEDNNTWHLCPIKDKDNAMGFIVAQWSKDATPTQLRSFKHLAEQLEAIIY